VARLFDVLAVNGERLDFVPRRVLVEVIADDLGDLADAKDDDGLTEG
jgi:hypothetical protein